MASVQTEPVQQTTPEPTHLSSSDPPSKSVQSAAVLAKPKDSPMLPKRQARMALDAISDAEAVTSEDKKRAVVTPPPPSIGDQLNCSVESEDKDSDSKSDTSRKPSILSNRRPSSGADNKQGVTFSEEVLVSNDPPTSAANEPESNGPEMPKSSTDSAFDSGFVYV